VVRIHVLVAFTFEDVLAEIIAERVAERSDMVLVGGHSVKAAEVNDLLDELSPSVTAAVIVVGSPPETDECARGWLARRSRLVVTSVEVIEDSVRITTHDPRLESLLNALRELVERGDTRQQVVREFQRDRPDVPPSSCLEQEPAQEPVDPVEPASRPLLAAAVRWVQELLRDAVARVPDGNGDLHGLSLTKATLEQLLAPSGSNDSSTAATDLKTADEALESELAVAGSRREPLALAYRALGLTRLEFRVLVLGLAPELDLRFQRCMGFLLDDMARRVGSLGLFSALLGTSVDIRRELARTGALDRWLVFDAGPQTAADEPLRIDPFLARWLLDEREALSGDARVGRVLLSTPWAGAALLQGHAERVRALRLIKKLRDPAVARFVLLDGDDAAGWRALVEVGANAQGVVPIRADVQRLADAVASDIDDCARRLGRMARLLGRVLIVDTSRVDLAGDLDWLRAFLDSLGRTGVSAAVVAPAATRIVELIASHPFDLMHEEALSTEARTAAIRASAKAADAYLTDEAASALGSQFPLRIDALEYAASLARSLPLDYSSDDPRLARFTAAARRVAAEGISRLADLIEPIFRLEDVVLPLDRRQQLIEIVDNVRLAPRVLDEWKFREQLPYGRGVTALFFGPSGTGKTMAAIGIARRLGVQLLRLDLSRVVSKYIGDTEKNLDRVFSDAERSGAAILIDEADALLGKRSEVKDAHDRYANIEVAFLLQRMEAYRGLAILTTNMRQSLDPAFLRRLRFIIDFPRPDAEAREKIWRLCLPEGSHTLDDASFRQLARRIDLTGGHIRQITLRAAFLAAAADTRINLDHIAQATRAELAKLGMPAVAIDTQGRQAA
jgi:hypothetical protein